MRGTKYGALGAIVLSIWIFTYGPLRNYRKAFLVKNPAQLIFVLGGDIDREHVGTKLAYELDLPILISGGSNPEYANWILKKAGIPYNKARLDYRAKDTLENFTSLIDELSEQNLNHILLITSEDHLRRAMLIGNIIAGSRGIHLSSIGISCEPRCKKETIKKQIFDLARAIIWVCSGEDLKKLHRKSKEIIEEYFALIS